MTLPAPSPGTTDGGERVVRVEPLGVELSLEEGESVMEAAHRHGYTWPTVCSGRASCGVCTLVVREGVDNCVSPEALELESLALLGLSQGPGLRRLACQMRVRGRVVVHALGVRLAPKSASRGISRTYVGSKR